MIFGRYPVSEDLQGWIEENFLWAAENGLLRPETPLVVPTRDFFRAPGGESHAVAEAVLKDLKRILRLESEAISLQPLDVVSGEYRLDYNALSAVGGTWQADGNAGVIHYDPELVKRPLPLISLLAHELMHHVLHAQPSVRLAGRRRKSWRPIFMSSLRGLGCWSLRGPRRWAGKAT